MAMLLKFTGVVYKLKHKKSDLAQSQRNSYWFIIVNRKNKILVPHHDALDLRNKIQY